ncbi:uncharacterized protein [Apostichopus japonicus]|uniref:uncharacterized protein isoform X2 n=1 Tax=Stichopus japonicus TaxID=307972 RepID=UPI003AB479EC
MGYSTSENWIYLFEGNLKQIVNERTAERWVELLKQPQTDNNNVRLSLVIYRSRLGVKAEKKTEHAINGDTVLGMEKGSVDQVTNKCNRYIALVLRTQSLLFQTDEKNCLTLYNILKNALRHASWRIYDSVKNAQPVDLALHLTTHFLSTSKVKTVRPDRCWPLSDICQVSCQGRTVSLTMFGANAPAGFRQFTLKNEQIALKCTAEVKARLSQKSEEDYNVYLPAPGDKQLAAPPAGTQDMNRSLSLDNKLSNPNFPHPPRPPKLNDESSRDSDVSNGGLAIDNPMYRSHHELWSSVMSDLVQSPHRTHNKPPLPLPISPRTSDSTTTRPVSSSSAPSSGGKDKTAPPVPARLDKHEFRQSLSMEEGRDRWDKFVSVMGVEEEIAKSKGKPDKYSQSNFASRDAKQITRTSRASIVPKRPLRKPRIQAEEEPDGKTASTESSFSLYTFLFQVWNSQEITADTLGMKLKTWNNFVVYFELLPGDVKDWKVFAERIGMSHMDIQVIDNYGRRFNECATAIVMLFWQQNSHNLKEEYSRPVLLKILQELEREDLIEVVTGQNEEL